MSRIEPMGPESRRYRAGLVLRVGAMSIALAGAALALVGPASGGFTGSIRVVDEVAVTPTHLDIQPSNNSPAILADPTDPRFVAMANRIDAPDFGCALQVSGDSGRTWVTATPVRKLPEGAEKCYAPEIAFDADGKLYYLFVGLRGAGNEPMGAFIVSSSDRARTFTEPARVLGPLNFSVRMAVDRDLGPRGRMHLVWLHATTDPPLGGFGPPPNPILTAYSDNGGKNFSRPVQVSEPVRQRVVAPALALGPDHAVHVAFYDLGRDAVDYQGLEGPTWDEPWSVVLSSSSDGGRTFGARRVVDDEIAAPDRVMLIFTMPPPALVAGTRGRVCVAWTDARNGDADAVARCSGDGGTSWKALRRLNDDRIGNGRSQYLPRLALSPGGRLDAVFFDRRDHAGNLENHVYLTTSVDDGDSFLPNRRISSAPSNPRIGAQYANVSARGQYEMGGRLGLLSTSSEVVAAWPDTRHSASGTTSQDLFTASVAMPAVDDANPASRWIGLVLLVAGFGGTVLSWRRPRRMARS